MDSGRGSSLERDRPCSAVGVARALYGLRGRRNEILGAALFGEPAWDMLLDLYVARREQQRPRSIMDLCVSSRVATTTALRYIAALNEQGLLLIENDPTDRRRRFVLLTGAGEARVAESLLSFVRAFGRECG